jgi:hypothetical protein
MRTSKWLLIWGPLWPLEPPAEAALPASAAAASAAFSAAASAAASATLASSAEMRASSSHCSLEFDAKALEALKSVDWTGNIRELRNIIERLVILCGPIISDVDVETYSNSKK